jgi:NAD(P)H-dependent flavin oxidoreductase YrpB (nitropropane dioxygenase family)
MHKKRVVEADYSDTIRTIIYSGRPMRVFKTPYNEEYERSRQHEIEESQAFGLPAFVKDVDAEKFAGANPSSVGTLALSEKRTLAEREKGIELSKHEEHYKRAVFLTGQCAGAISDIKPAQAIIDEMVQLAAEQLRTTSTYVVSKL